MRQYFYLRGSLFVPKIDLGWIAAIALALGLSIVLAVGNKVRQFLYNEYKGDHTVV